MSRSSNLTWLEREAQQLPNDELLKRANSALEIETSDSGTHITETLVNEIARRICNTGEGFQLRVDEVVNNASEDIVSGVLGVLKNHHEHIYQLAETLRGEYEAEYKEMRRDLLGDGNNQWWGGTGNYLPGIFDMDAAKVAERQAEMQKKLEKHGESNNFLYSASEYADPAGILGYSQVYYFNPETKFPDLPSVNYRYGDSEKINDLLDKINTTRHAVADFHISDSEKQQAITPKQQLTLYRDRLRQGTGNVCSQTKAQTCNKKQYGSQTPLEILKRDRSSLAVKFLKGVVKLAAFLGVGGIPPMLMAMSESKKAKGTTDIFAPKGRELTHAVEKTSKKLGIT